MKFRKWFSKILVSLCCVLTVFAFTGCGPTFANNRVKVESLDSSIYVFLGCTYIDSDNSLYTFYHIDTKVMYVFWDGYGNGGLQPLLSADGTPLLYQDKSPAEVQRSENK